MTDDDRTPHPAPEPAGDSTDETGNVFHDRMLAAAEYWLLWCASNGGVDPINTTVDHIHLAALDLRAAGGSEMDVFDLLDQVGFMTDLWRTAEWLALRRTI